MHELAEGVAAGEAGATAAFYRRYGPGVLRGARAYLPAGHQSSAEDVVSVVLSGVVDALGRGWKATFDLGPYLRVAARHEVWRQVRRREREALLGESRIEGLIGAAGTDAASDRDGDQNELDRELVLAQAFGALNERFQRIIWLAEVEGVPTAQLASDFGLRPNAVAALRYRARQALRDEYLRAGREGAVSQRCRELSGRVLAYRLAGRPDGPEFGEVRDHLLACRTCTDLFRGTARRRPLEERPVA